MRSLHLFILSFFAAAAFAQEPCRPHFSYWGYYGPEKWKDFPIPDNECGGNRQSPINLPTSAGTVGEDIIVDYTTTDDPTNATIQNTGHDFEVRPTKENNTIKIGGQKYTLVKFHFHVPGEHQIGGGAVAPAEMHIVHERFEGGKPYLAVIGVRLTIGGEYPALEPVFNNLSVCLEPRPLKVDFRALLPQKLSGYYEYPGSLTTPPCSQNVTWYVLGTSRTILEADRTKLRALGENARPPQNPRPQAVKYIRPNKQ
jgi:carbonic anhydrase